MTSMAAMANEEVGNSSVFSSVDCSELNHHITPLLIWV